METIKVDSPKIDSLNARKRYVNNQQQQQKKLRSESSKMRKKSVLPFLCSSAPFSSDFYFLKSALSFVLHDSNAKKKTETQTCTNYLIFVEFFCFRFRYFHIKIELN